MFFRLFPKQNASPVPVRTTALIGGSTAAKASMVATKASIISGVKALPTAGSSNRITASDPSTSRARLGWDGNVTGSPEQHRQGLGTPQAATVDVDVDSVRIETQVRQPVEECAEGD